MKANNKVTVADKISPSMTRPPLSGTDYDENIYLEPRMPSKIANSIPIRQGFLGFQGCAAETLIKASSVDSLLLLSLVFMEIGSESELVEPSVCLLLFLCPFHPVPWGFSR